MHHHARLHQREKSVVAEYSMDVEHPGQKSQAEEPARKGSDRNLIPHQQHEQGGRLLSEQTMQIFSSIP
jgi:hypothetical protein